MEKLRPAFDASVRDDADSVYRMVMTELEYLLFSGQVYVRPSEETK